MIHTSDKDHTHSYPKMRAAHLDRQCAVNYISMFQTKRNSADLWWLAKIHSHPTVNSCATFHMSAKQITVVCARETHRHVMQQNENSAKLMTAEIKTAQTRFHKSKFCPVRNRPKLWNFQKMNERVNKNFQDSSKLQIHAGLSLTALCTAFCILHCNCRSSLPELGVTTQLASESKSISSNLCYKPLKQFSWLPIQTCTGGCRSRRTPKPS